MRVLITGGCGMIGGYVVDAVLEKGHQVAIFDRRPPSSVDNRVEMRIGDLRDREAIAQAIKDIDVVIHMAAILPPLSETDLQLSEDINVGGTANLIAAMEGSAACRRLIFASSTAVHGSRLDRKYPITADEPLDPPDNYARQKVVSEAEIRHSTLDWTILRIPACPTTRLGRTPPGSHKLMFKIPPDSRIEVLHPEDAGTAFANAVTSLEVVGKTLLLGGGRQNGCQLSGYEFASGITRAVGIGTLPRSVFNSDPGGAHAEWLDTAESQRVLRYQNHSFSDLTRDLSKSLGVLYYISRAVSPLVRLSIVRSLKRQ